jgi:hypothetical protein
MTIEKITIPETDDYIYLPMFYLTKENNWIIMGYQKYPNKFMNEDIEE